MEFALVQHARRQGAGIPLDDGTWKQTGPLGWAVRGAVRRLGCGRFGRAVFALRPEAESRPEYSILWLLSGTRQVSNTCPAGKAKILVLSGLTAMRQPAMAE